MCNSEGHWLSQLPYCVRYCSHPFEVVQNSLIPKPMKYVENEVVTLLCAEGYISSLNTTWKCLGTGSWEDNSEMPECIPLTCHKPAVDNLLVSGENTFNSTVRFACQKGYKLNGRTNVTCSVGGLWDAKWPHCEEIDCLDPPNIENGVVKFESTLFQAKTEYSCNTGYTLDGVKVVTCGDNSTWYPKKPLCEPVQCHDALTASNGELVNKNKSSSYMTRVQLICNRGYALEGNNETRCSALGVWQPEVRTHQ